MRIPLLPITGFALLAIAVAAIVMGIRNPAPIHGRSSTKEIIVSAAPSSAISLTDNILTEESEPSRDSLVSRQRRSKSQDVSLKSKTPAPASALSQAASREAIHAALRAAGPTTLSVLRPINFPSTATPKGGSSGLIAVNPDAPGNRLTTDEQTMTVEAYQPVRAGNELTIHMTPSSEGSRSEFNSGFTHEEEQFRARWGWAAFDQIQRAAKNAATETR